MKKVNCVVLLSTLLLLVGLSSVQAATASWLKESRDYAVGDTLGTWQILEYRDANQANANKVWLTSGTAAGGENIRYSYNKGKIINGSAVHDASVMWFTGRATASTTFTVASTAVAIMLEADANDIGKVSFDIDGNDVSIDNLYAYLTTCGGVASWQTKGGASTYANCKIATLVISGLDLGIHSVKISGNDDFHVLGAAAVSAVPLPGAAWLLGSGLLGLLGLRRKNS